MFKIHVRTCKQKYHKIQQTKICLNKPSTLLCSCVVGFCFQENCVYYLHRSHASVTPPYSSYIIKKSFC